MSDTDVVSPEYQAAVAGLADRLYNVPVVTPDGPFHVGTVATEALARAALTWLTASTRTPCAMCGGSGVTRCTLPRHHDGECDCAGCRNPDCIDGQLLGPPCAVLWGEMAEAILRGDLFHLRAMAAEGALRRIADRHPDAAPGEHPAVDIARAALDPVVVP